MERSAGRHHRFGEQHQHEAHPRAKRDIQLPLCPCIRTSLRHSRNQMKSAVTRIAINIFRIISIIALLRSLESLLPGGERSGEPQENIVRTLLNCPGLTPSAHIPQENIADGIVPQFNLSIRTDDFYAVLALVEPLYAMHATFSRSCPQEPHRTMANMTPETLFDCLPLRFTRNEAIDKGEQVGVPAGRWTRC